MKCIDEPVRLRYWASAIRAARFFAIFALPVASMIPAVAHARPLPGASVEPCHGGCIVVESGFGRMPWPNKRTGLAFRAPGTFFIGVAVSQCRAGHYAFTLRLHRGRVTITPVDHFRTVWGNRAVGVSGRHSGPWQPEVISQCRWVFRVSSTAMAPPVPYGSMPSQSSSLTSCVPREGDDDNDDHGKPPASWDYDGCPH